MPNTDTTKKKKAKFSPVMLVFIVIGGLCGFFGASAMDTLSQGNAPFPLVIAFLIIAFYFAIFITIIVHEAGHLVMGLLTGYEFVSFRVGSLTFIKENGKLVRRKFNIVGTGGQCILTHSLVEHPEDIPYFWYHFGGVFFNFLTVLVLLPVIFLAKNTFVVAGAAIFAVVSGFLGLINLIPSAAMGMGNDGYNLVQLKKSAANRIAVYKTMVINGLQYQGMRLEDMDESLVTFPDDEKNCVFGTALTILEANLLMNRRQFAEAAALYRSVVDDETAYTIYRNECTCELLFCLMMDGCTPAAGDQTGEAGISDNTLPKETVAEIESLYDKELKQYVKATGKTYVSRKRLLYAYYLLVQKDVQKAEAEYRLAKEMEKTYPGKGEYLSEMSLIEYVRDLRQA